MMTLTAFAAFSLLVSTDQTIVRVVDRTGDPVPNVWVFIAATSEFEEPYIDKGKTDADGVFATDALLPGRYTNPKSYPQRRPALWRCFFEAKQQPGPHVQASSKWEERKWAVSEDYPRRVTLILGDISFHLTRIHEEQQRLATTDHSYRYESATNQFFLESYSQRYQVAKMVCEERVRSDGCRYTVCRPIYETCSRKVIVRRPSTPVVTGVPVVPEPPCSCQSPAPLH